MLPPPEPPRPEPDDRRPEPGPAEPRGAALRWEARRPLPLEAAVEAYVGGRDGPEPAPERG